jgi:hypothetical protein
MAHSTYPVTPAGLAVPVLVGLGGKATAALHAAGQPIPPPVHARGLLDTCSDLTAVAAQVLQQLAIPSIASGNMRTAAGSGQVGMYQVSLSIASLAQAGGLLLTEPTLLVAEIPTALPDTDVLIGLDILRRGRLWLDGPAGQFTLEL